MAVRNDAVARPAKHSHNSIIRKKRTLKRLTRKLGRMRDELQVVKQSYETDKAGVEEKERQIAQQKRQNDLALTQDALLRQGITSITLDMVDGGRSANTMTIPSFSELVSDLIEGGIADLLSAGHNQE